MADVKINFITDATQTFDSTKALAEQIGELSKSVKDLSEKFKKPFNDSNDAISKSNKAMRELTGNIQIAGVNVSDLADAFKRKTSAIGTVIKSLNLLKIALIATGIGAFVVAIGSLIAFFKRTEEGAEKLERVMSGLGAAFDVVVGAAAQIGKVLSGEATLSIKNFGNDLSNLAKKAIEAANAQAELTRRTQELEDVERGSAFIFSKNQTIIEKSLIQARNLSLSTEERLSLLEDASKLEEINLSIQLQNANARLKIIKDENTLIKNTGTLRDSDRQKEIDAIVKRDELERQSLNLQEKIQNRKDAIIQAAQEKFEQEQLKTAERRLKLEEDLQSALNKLIETSEKARIDQLTGTERIEAEFLASQKIINNLEKEIIEKGKLLDKNFKLTKEQEQQLTNLRLANEQNRSKAIIALIKENERKRREAEKDTEADAISEASKMVDENLKLLQDQNKARILLTKEGTQARIDAEIKAIETERDFILNNTQLTVDQQIIIIEEAKAKLAALQQTTFSLADLLGLSKEEFARVKDSLSSIVGSVQSILQTQYDDEKRLLDKRKELNDELLRDREDKVDELEDQLERELELNEKGLASNLSLVKSQLEEATKAKNAALEEEKRIKKEQEELTKKQLLIEAAQQASSLISAGATLFAKGAFQGPVGIAVAAATIAGMVATFLSIKNKIKEATSPGFYDGGYTGEGSEREEAGVVHKREFVSTAKTTKKYRPLLEALHNEDFSRLRLPDIKPLLDGTGVTMPDLDKINKSMPISSGGSNANTEKFSRLEKKFNEFLELYKNKPEKTTLPDGTLEIRKGNSIKRIKPKHGKY